MVNIAIIDDLQIERDNLKQCLAYVSQMQGEQFSVQEYSSASQFLLLYEQQFDIIFMDIMLHEEIDGMEAARQLRAMDQSVLLIFVTNLAQMAVHGYEVDALDFVVKPLDHYAFHLKMQRALRRIPARNRAVVMIRDRDNGTYYIESSRIQYLEVEGHSVAYHTREGIFHENISLTAAEEKINDPAFFRCDRGRTINMRMISRIHDDLCTVDGIDLVVARVLKGNLKRMYAQYLSGKHIERG